MQIQRSHSDESHPSQFLNQLNRTVVVAVVPVRMVEMAIDQVIDMIAMRDGLMAAIGAMHMTGLMFATVVVGGASVGVLLVHFERVFVHMVPMGMVQMAVMEIIGVAGVPDGNMPAIGAVLVGVVLVLIAFVHNDFRVELNSAGKT